MNLSNRTQKLTIYALTLLAFILRAYRLGAQSYWIDEAWTVYFANLPIADMWHLMQTTEIMPPLYHPATIYWVKLVGDGEYALRFFSLVFGVMTVPFTYRLGKDLGDYRLGLVAALLITVAPYQVWHSQDARMYAVFTAASAMSMWGFVNVWQRGGWRWWLIYVIGTEWAIMTHYHGAVIIGVQGLFVLLTWRRRRASRELTAWIGGLLVVFLAFLPWLFFGGGLLGSYLNWIEQTTLWDTYIRSAIAYSVGELVPRLQAIPLALVFVTVYALGLIYSARRSWGAWRGTEMLTLLLTFTLAPNVAAWLYGEFRTTVYFERYLIPVQIGFLLAISAGVLAVADGLRGRLGRGATTLAGLVTSLLLVISGWVLFHHYTDPAYAKPDWRATAETIQSFELPGDAIVITGDGGEKAFNYYYRGNAPIYVDFNSPVPSELEARQIIDGITRRHRRIWYTPYGVDIDATLENWLAQNAYPAWQSWLGRKRLRLYAGNTSPTDRHETLDVTFGDSQRALTLERVALPGQATSAGDVVPLILTWSAAGDSAEDYKLSLRLTNEQGDVFVQSDWPPLAQAGARSPWQPGQPVADRRGLWLPPDVPPGDYVLDLLVYSPSSGQPVGQSAALPDLKVAAAQTVVPEDALSIPNSIRQPMGGLMLVGYTLPENIRPGEEVSLWLYWQAGDGQLPPPDSTLHLGLAGAGEPVHADYPLVDSVGPLDSWQPGQVRRAVYHLPSDPRLSGDEAEVRVSLLLGAGQVEADATLARVELETRPRQFEAPTMAHQTVVAFENPTLLKLIGYDLPATDLAAGDTLPVTLYWQAERDMEIDYTVFVQLLNSDWQVVAQEDLGPQAGAAPTTTWLPGEILADPHRLSLPSTLQTGDYRLIAGMYDAVSGRRLSVSTGGDFVDLGMVTVK